MESQNQDWKGSGLWIGLFAGLIRKVLFAVGLYLTSLGVDNTTINGISSLGLAEFLAGGLFTIFPIIWHYAKIKYDELVKRLASDSEKEVPLAVTETEVSSTRGFVSRY